MVRHTPFLSQVARDCFCALAVLASLPGLAVEGIQVEASFTMQTGTIPFAALTSAGHGLFYGTTISDAGNNEGGVYSFASASGAITLLDSFQSDLGTVPFAALTAAGGGIYVGTSSSGGENDLGSVFAFDSATSTLHHLGSFDGANGAYPYSELLSAGGDLYYGTTYSGGASDLGGVYSLDTRTGAITLLDSFTGSNGANPLAALIPAGGGLFYGTVGQGGSNNLGGIYAFDSTSGTISLKASFQGVDGAIPHAPLTSAGGGTYYGTTRFGGSSGLGAVFAFNSDTSTITLQDSFTGTNGSSPFAPLTSAGEGLFYGTTNSGGTHDLGTIFAFNSLVGAITAIDSFSGANGSNPLAGLTAGDGGVYYGTTVQGGAENAGVIYSFHPVPGPLPLWGASVAWVWCRQLRQRTQRNLATPRVPRG
ncbi:MAG: hypothetical protein RLZZ117_2047 [Cyanobacteriota bacterium]|jgi:uncharacterized repeat protein (TIGR03803 family)